MFFKLTKIKQVYLIKQNRKKDKRGFFSRLWCKKILADKGLNSKLVQISISYSSKTGTIRGLHYQSYPFRETKVVTCISGAIFDVVVDVRKNSPTYGKWISFELNEKNGFLIYIPEGCAHGFQTLKENTRVLYFISQFHNPKYERGIVWNDPTLAIPWPLPVTNISEKDKNLPLLCYNDA